MTKTKRNANIEALRMLSMLMVVFLHALMKSDLLLPFTEENLGNPNLYIAWIIEMLSIVAVNVFILISGYFLAEAEFKAGRLITLVAQAIFYSLGAFLICLAAGIIDKSELNIYDAVPLIFPIQTEVFWFLSFYVLVYVLQPVLTKGMKALSQKKARLIIGLLLAYECIFKSVLPSTFYTDAGGYSFLWFLTVFLSGIYLRLYGFGFLQKPGRGLAVYFGASFVNLLVVWGTQYVSLTLGHLREFENISLCYNNVFVFLASLGIFAFFANKKAPGQRMSRVICALSPMALGVYLAHENLALRYRWQKWLGLTGLTDQPAAAFLGRLIAAALIIYVIGTAIDFVRIQIFKLCKKLYSKN